MCKLYDVLYSALPFIFFRAWLIRHHFQKCPRCQERFVLQSVQSFEQDECRLESPTVFWRGVEAKIHRKRVPDMHGRGAFSPLLGFAYAAVLLIFFVMLNGFIQLQTIMQERSPLASARAKNSQFTLLSARIEGNKANAFIFKPEGNQMIIVFYKKD